MGFYPTAGTNPSTVQWLVLPGFPSSLDLVWPDGVPVPSWTLQVPAAGLTVASTTVGQTMRFSVDAGQVDSLVGRDWVLTDSGGDPLVGGRFERWVGRGGPPSGDLTVTIGDGGAAELVVRVVPPMTDPSMLVQSASGLDDGTMTSVLGGAWVARSPAQVRTAIDAEIAGTAQVKADAAQAYAIQRANHAGVQSLDTTTDSVSRLALSPAERSKLAGVGVEATKNATDAALRDRALHTGVQAQSTVDGLVPDLAAKVPASRTVAGKALTADVALVKADVGLGAVDNTSDAAKPLSTASTNALAAKAADADVVKLAGTQTLAGLKTFTSPTPVAPHTDPLAPTGFSVPTVKLGGIEVRDGGTGNMALGQAAGGTLTTGAYNSIVGYAAGYSLTTGAYNSIVGYAAGYSLTTGANNSLVGYAAGRFLTTGANNSIVGYLAGYSLTTGANNSIMGRSAGYSLTTGANNSIMGRSAGHGADPTLIGANGVAIGADTGAKGGDVSGFTAIGQAARATTDAFAGGRAAIAAHAGSVALGASTTTTAIDQVMIGPRDLEITDTTKGVVLRSPDGTRYRIKVANGGALSVVAA